MVDVTSYSELIERLSVLEPPVFVFGGFAEDAVLYGKVTRPHGDVDVLVLREQLDVHLAQFQAMGFPALSSYFDIAPGEPLVLGSESNGLNLEVCVFDSIIGGRLSCRLPSADGAVHRVTLAAGAIDGIPRLLDGTPIRTVSPLGLFQIRAASHHLRAFGELRPTDAAPQRLLRERFLSERSEGDLLPDIEALAR